MSTFNSNNNNNFYLEINSYTMVTAHNKSIKKEDKKCEIYRK